MVLELKRCVFEEKTEDGHGYFDDRPKDAGKAARCIFICSVARETIHIVIVFNYRMP